jgi:hypothetical protein
MKKVELLDTINGMLSDAVTYNGDFMEMQEENLDYYMGNPFGDEVDGQSKAVSTDAADVVEADMPSHARVFLGGNDVLKFEPLSARPDDKQEADEKTAYINWIVRGQPTSFKTLIDWIKGAEIHSISVVHFYCKEERKAEEITYNGLSEDEIAQFKMDLTAEKDVSAVKIISKEEDGERWNITFKVTRTKRKHVVDNIPIENFIITRNCATKEEADIIGHLSYPRRGELVAQGYDKKLIAELPAQGQTRSDRMAEIRFASQGGFNGLSSKEMNQRIEIQNLYPLLDYDGDGTLSRRYIRKCGEEILDDESYGIAPYAILSAITMPHTVIGRSRVEITKPTQIIKSYLYRGILNNAYKVNNPRWAVNDKENGVNLDDFLTERLDGIIRCGGDPATQVMPVLTPYIGDKTLQVIQYVDAARAQTTGSLMASQGLEIDSLHKETATRFQGVADASVAKVELVARVFAETGFRDLYEGLAWQVKHYQDEPSEVMVLGKPMTVNPGSWRYEHCAYSQVGLGAGDSDSVKQDMAALVTMLEQLRQSGLPIVDSKKIYNGVAKIVKAMGLSKVSDFVNDPEQPQELLLAQVEQLTMQIQQMQQGMQQMAQEADANMIKARAQIAIEDNRARISQDKIAIETEADFRKFLLDQATKQEQFNRDFMARITEMDLKYNGNAVDDIPGTMENNA